MEGFDEARFCNMLEERLNEKWDEVMREAEKRQREKLAELEEKIKIWEDLGPPSFDKMVLYHEGEKRLFNLKEALKSVKERGVRRVFVIVHRKGGKAYRIGTLTIEVDDTLKSLREVLNKRYEDLLKEYEGVKKNLLQFIDWEHLKKIGEMAALKKQIC